MKLARNAENIPRANRTRTLRFGKRMRVCSEQPASTSSVEMRPREPGRTLCSGSNVTDNPRTLQAKTTFFLRCARSERHPRGWRPDGWPFSKGPLSRLRFRVARLEQDAKGVPAVGGRHALRRLRAC